MYEGIVQVLKKYDEALDLDKSENYTKSIQFSLNGLVFCLAEENKILAVESWQFRAVNSPQQLLEKIQLLFNGNKWLSKSVGKSMLLFESEYVTLIPDPLFDENEIESLANFNFSTNEKSELKFDNLFHAESKLLFGLPHAIATEVRGIFGKAELRSHAGILIDSVLLYGKNQTVPMGMFVNVRDKFIDILVTRNNKLLFFNSFGYSNQDDFIYFIIFVLEQLGINPEDIELTLLGLIDKNSHLFDRTYKYIRKVNFAALPQRYSYSYVIKEIPSHYYFTLFNSI